ncbi:MAG: DNA primase [Sphaerochaetaceae bacterium]
MAKISESVIEEIKNRISIIEVISPYLTLTRKGDRYWGLCPFHEEKTPSFSVLPEKGFFHCFGCNKSGSIFDFVMEMEHLSFPEALKKLAEKAGVPLAQETAAQRKMREETEALRLLYEKLAASFHYILLNSESAQTGRDYIYKRGFTDASIERFHLGFAPEDPQWLYSFLLSKQYSEDLLKKSGLFARRNGTYPLFRNRLMFPIRDWQGRVVAFGGRDLSGTSQAKYINTPETALYRKREIAYGLYEGLKAIKEQEQVVVCEGYFDVIAMHQSGLETAVAPLGTAFTTEQAKLIKRYAHKLSTLFDSDKAGTAATKKTLIIAQGSGFETQVIHLQGAKDPAELLEKEGPDVLAKACSSSKSGFHHLVHSAISLYDSTKATGKLQIFKEIKPYLDAVESQIVRQSYLRDLAGYLQVDESTLQQDYQKETSVKKFQGGTQPKTSASKEKEWKGSIDLYALLTVINNRSLFPSVRNRLRIEYLMDERAVELYTLLEESQREGSLLSNEVLLTKIQDSELRQRVAQSFQTKEFTIQPERVIEDSVLRITLRHIEGERKRVEHLIRIGEKEGSTAVELSHLLLEKKALDEQIAEAKNKRNE